MTGPDWIRRSGGPVLVGAILSAMAMRCKACAVAELNQGDGTGCKQAVVGMSGKSMILRIG